MNRSGGVPQGYDVIGDVHGHAAKLVELLEAMSYALIGDVWSHSSRQALVVGDLIDRGPQQVETVAIVRSMVEAGTATSTTRPTPPNARRPRDASASRGLRLPKA